MRKVTRRSAWTSGDVGVGTCGPPRPCAGACIAAGAAADTDRSCTPTVVTAIRPATVPHTDRVLRNRRRSFMTRSMGRIVIGFINERLPAFGFRLSAFGSRSCREPHVRLLPARCQEWTHRDTMAARPMASIFISYRREDAGGHAGRLCDRLTARFGNDRVFMDIQDIHPGQNFATSIADTIATCDCVIAVIGPHWLESVQKRAKLPDDFVRHEIGAGLQRHVTVIPVLVGGARMPAAEDLPADLKELSYLNAIEIRDERFDRDVVELETFLASQLHVAAAPAVPAGQQQQTKRRLMVVIPIVVVAAAIGGYFLLAPSGSPRRRNPNVQVVAPIDIAGNWIAEMESPGQRPYRIRLHFEQVGSRLTGLVRYPTGDGAFSDGALNGSTLTFSTSHTPQFGSGPVTTHFLCEATADRIRLSATYDGGMATGVATRRRN